jgi:Transposase DDE domain
MDGNLWEQVYHLTMTTEYPNPTVRAKHSDRVIVLVQLRAALDNISINRATHADSWVGLRRPESLPSQATMSRRLKKPAVTALLTVIEERLRQLPRESLKAAPAQPVAIDARALAASRFTKDPDAKWGYGTGGLQIGYKFHAIWDQGAVPLAWCLEPLNACEPIVARRLIRQLPPTARRRYLMGDAAYDSDQLYASADLLGYQLLAPAKRPGKALGHRRYSPSRIYAQKLLRSKRGQKLYTQRTLIERQFGNWSVRPEGLSELPKHVRRLHRVRLYVHAKMILNGVRILINRQHLPLPLAA